MVTDLHDHIVERRHDRDDCKCIGLRSVGRSNTTSVMHIGIFHRLGRKSQRMTTLPLNLNVINRMIDTVFYFVGKM